MDYAYREFDNVLINSLGEDYDRVKNLDRVTDTNFIYGGLNLVYGLTGVGKSYQLVTALSKASLSVPTAYFETDIGSCVRFTDHCASNDVMYVSRVALLKYREGNYKTSTLLDATLNLIATTIEDLRAYDRDCRPIFVFDSISSMCEGQDINNYENTYTLFHKLNKHASTLNYCLIIIDNAVRLYNANGEEHGFKLEGKAELKKQATITTSRYTPISYRKPEKGGYFTLEKTKLR